MKIIKNQLLMVKIIIFVGLAYSVGVIAALLPFDQLTLAEVIVNAFNQCIDEVRHPPRYGWNYFLLPLTVSILLLLYLLGNITFEVFKSIGMYLSIIVILLCLTVVGFAYGDGIVFVLGSLIIELFAAPFLLKNRSMRSDTATNGVRLD